MEDGRFLICISSGTCSEFDDLWEAEEHLRTLSVPACPTSDGPKVHRGNPGRTATTAPRMDVIGRDRSKSVGMFTALGKRWPLPKPPER